MIRLSLLMAVAGLLAACAGGRPAAVRHWGITVAEGMRTEPDFDLEHDPGTDRSFFSWTSVAGSGASSVSLLCVDAAGRELWRAAPAMARGGAGREFEARIAASSSAIFAAWDEVAGGSITLNAEAFGVNGSTLPLKDRIYGLSRVSRGSNVVVPLPGGTAAAAWEDLDPGLDTTYVGVAELGPAGVRWQRIMGDRSRGERYMAPVVAPSGDGGVLAAFRLIDNGDRGIVVRKFSADGSAWPLDVQASDAFGYKSSAQITSNGLGGAYVVWEDGRNGNIDLYAQQISSAGAVMWRTDGVPLAVTDGNSWNPVIAPDGKGGFFCAWIDDNQGSQWQLKMQRLGPDGRPLWGADAVTVCPSDSRQSVPSLVPDGSGGAIVVWNEDRYGPLDIFAQRFSAAGARLWPAGGARVDNSGRDHLFPQVEPDGKGGFLVAWKEKAEGKWRIMAQRLNASCACVWK